MLTPQGRKEQSHDALRRAREKGAEVLPLPIIGERFEFRLTTATGETVDSESYRGKVLLIDGWATWCTPCMQKMPGLKELYDKLHRQGFEIIGVNFDNKPSRGRAAIEKLELKWTHVLVPADDETRELFDEASSFMPLPRLVLIGRDGNVAAVCSPGELEEEVTKLVKRPLATQPAPASP
ncbi:MAG: TlpA family protein disulfide reductase [Phycisphaerae bacterium]|nr:TlpA family protein disulfide reductase [Phycisphaerae bacterium]NUQ47959.1 TlpA family protein disulfide reductase [Phycisphaerae bacterium]